MDRLADPLRDRDVRQREIVPPNQLASCHVLVIGVGAIGRQVALQLAAVGVPRMTLVDHDTVEVENLAAQGYWPTDLDSAKVYATKSVCAQIHPGCDITPIVDRFRRSLLRDVTSTERLAAFVCVDSIRTRKVLWEVLRQQAAVFLDGRMSAEVLRVLTADRPATNTHYESTLFEANEAFAGSCTAKSTIYTASVAAGLMLGQFTKWLRGLNDVAPDITLNLLSMEMSIPEPNAA